MISIEGLLLQAQWELDRNSGITVYTFDGVEHRQIASPYWRAEAKRNSAIDESLHLVVA